MMPSCSPHAQIIFSHGNSFPAGTYGVLLRALEAKGYAVHALDRFGHDRRYPVVDNWAPLVDELMQFCHAVPRSPAVPRYLVGHSMGGLLSLLAASRDPALASAVVLLDPPLVTGWRAMLLRASKRTALAHRLSPGATSHRRRQEWPSVEAVLQHFSSKPVFARWHPEALHDYAQHGTRPAPTAEEPSRRLLAFDRDIETRIYTTLPDHIGGWLRRHPVQCPVSFIGGSESRETRMAGLSAMRRLTHGHMTMVSGGSHLFPMEMPQLTADLIDQQLREAPNQSRSAP